MRFSHKDKKDDRVVKHSTYPLDYPSKISEAPDQHGVYILMDSEQSVIYVGATSTEGLQKTIKANSKVTLENKITQYRWFITKNSDGANSLKKDWIKKYELQQ